MHPSTETMSPSLLPRLLFILATWLLSSVSLGAPGPEEAVLRPKWVVKDARLQAQNSDGVAALIDTRDRLWLTAWPGSSWMLPRSRIDKRPDGIEFGDLLVLWSTERSGLWIKQHIQLMSPTGRLLMTEAVEAPIIDVIASGDQVAILLPGELVLVTPRSDKSQRIPLPFVHPQSAEILDGTWVIRDAQNRTVEVNPATGCPARFEPSQRALERWMTHKMESVCDLPLPLPDGVAKTAELQRDAAIEAAAIASDHITLAAMGVRSKAQMKRIRPKEGRRPGSFRTRDEGLADVPEELLGGGFTVFVKHPISTIPLKEWVTGSNAPACHARILFMPENKRTSQALQLRLRALRSQRGNCAHSLYLTEVDAVDLNYDWAWYVDDESHRVGRRTGKPTARQVRMDLARLKQDDPLRALAERPELYTEWSEGPGPSYELHLDIDGSWIGDSGWDLISGSPSHDRINRVELAGPVRDIRVLESGLVEAKTGGQPVRVEFRWASGRVEWLEEWPDSEGRDRDQISRRLSHATGELGESWRVSKGRVYRQASDGESAGPQPTSEKLQEDEVEPPNQLEGKGPQPQANPGGPRMVNGNIVVTLPVPAIRAVPIEGGAIIQTDFGLVGIDTGGSIRWRLTEVNDFVVTRRWLITATPWGIQGQRIPPPVQQASPGGGGGSQNSPGGSK